MFLLRGGFCIPGKIRPEAAASGSKKRTLYTKLTDDVREDFILNNRQLSLRLFGKHMNDTELFDLGGRKLKWRACSIR